MADPIIQDPTQQVGSQKNNSDIDLNLNIPTNTDTQNDGNNDISFDFSVLDNNTKNIDTKVQTDPTIILLGSPDNNEAKPDIILNSENTDNTINKPEQTAEPIIQESVSIAEETTTPNDIQIENTEAPTQIEAKDDNRLDQEDALVKENKEEITNIPVENKEIPEIKSESLNMFSDVQNNKPELNQTTETNSIQTENTLIQTEPVSIVSNDNPVIAPEIPVAQELSQPTSESTVISENNISTQSEQNISATNPILSQDTSIQPEQTPMTNLEQDHAIIKQLQESAGKTAEITQIPQTVQAVPTPTEVNLDDLLSAPQVQATNNMPATNIPAANIPTMPQMPAFIPGIQGYQMPTIAPNPVQKSNPINKKILINFAIGITILLIGGFLFKTMYPIEYKQITENAPEQTINSGLNSNTDFVYQDNTGDISTDTGDGLFENPSLANYHGSADELSGGGDNFNAYEDIETSMDQNNSSTKQKLQSYIDQGKKYLVIGKKTNDKELTKYSLFLYKKASELLGSIENGDQITTDELTAKLADFETYLQKITGSPTDDTIVLQQPETPTPQEFFGSENSGDTQDISTGSQESEITEPIATQPETAETQANIETIPTNPNTID